MAGTLLAFGVGQQQLVGAERLLGHPGMLVGGRQVAPGGQGVRMPPAELPVKTGDRALVERYRVAQPPSHPAGVRQAAARRDGIGVFWPLSPLTVADDALQNGHTVTGPASGLERRGQPFPGSHRARVGTAEQPGARRDHRLPVHDRGGGETAVRQAHPGAEQHRMGFRLPQQLSVGRAECGRAVAHGLVQVHPTRLPPCLGQCVRGGEDQV
jgi:hypothetical protein